MLARPVLVQDERNQQMGKKSSQPEANEKPEGKERQANVEQQNEVPVKPQKSHRRRHDAGNNHQRPQTIAHSCVDLSRGQGLRETRLSTPIAAGIG